MAPFVRYAGRLLYRGDSRVRGFAGNTGGFRPATTTAIAAAGPKVTEIGGVADNGLCWAVDGETLATAIANDAATLNTLRAGTVVHDHLTNDIPTRFLTDGADPTNCLAMLATYYAMLRTAYPAVRIIRPSLVVPTGGGTYPTYFAAVALFSAVNTALPAWCAANSTPASPIVFCSFGAPVLQADALHEIDGPTGYGSLVTPVTTAALSVIP